jgi:hypothetical protein
MTSELLGPYDLTFDALEHLVPDRQCGVFALGHLGTDRTFRVQSVGREDRDLKLRLRGLIGSSGRFKFAPMPAPRQAFEAECALFHRFRPPGSFIHPDRPAGTDWGCPVCFDHARR